MTFEDWWMKLTTGYVDTRESDRLALAKATSEAAWYVGYNEGMKKTVELVEELEPHKEGP